MMNSCVLVFSSCKENTSPVVMRDRAQTAVTQRRGVRPDSAVTTRGVKTDPENGVA